MSDYNDLDMMIDFHDPKRYVDGCKCEPDVNHICELCMTYNVLREAKRMLMVRDAEIERLQKDRSRSENELDRLREWVAAVEDVYDKQKAEIERLRAIINAKLHRRKCHDCGHVGWYADSRTPYCLCEQCKSQDTRLVKEEK